MLKSKINLEIQPSVVYTTKFFLTGAFLRNRTGIYFFNMYLLNYNMYLLIFNMYLLKRRLCYQSHICS